MAQEKPRRTTVADVARRAGVSAMTVSNVLNAPHRVADPTVRTVRAAIDELGYTPNHAARALSSGRSQVIGLPLYLEDEAFSDQNPGLGGFLHGLLGGLVKAAAVSGYGVHVTTPTEGATEIALYEKLIAARQVDAIVVLETMPRDERIEFLSQRRFPFVAFGRTGPQHRQCWVDVDNETSMAGIAQHLRSTGRSRAVYLATDSALPWVHQRQAGFLREFPSADVRVVRFRSRQWRRTSRTTIRRMSSSPTTTRTPWSRYGRCSGAGSRSARTSRSPGSTTSRSPACSTRR